MGYVNSATPVVSTKKPPPYRKQENLMAPNIPLEDRVIGYPKLAGQIELRQELAIFRRFGALNAKNLLYLQAELSLLELDLEKQERKDKHSLHPRKCQYALNWHDLSTSETNGDEHQLKLVHKIRETLKQYSRDFLHVKVKRTRLRSKTDDALIQQAQILSYPEPDRYDLTYMQIFLQNMVDPMHGPDSSVWGTVLKPESNSPDLITLCPRQKEDAFSSWVVENAIERLFCCLNFRKPSKKHGEIGYEDTKVLRITYYITSMLASLIPIASITVLYCIRSMPARLGVISVFNVFVSICLIAFTNAKRAEVFAITAAYVSRSHLLEDEGSD
jgi:hypothetical protein